MRSLTPKGKKGGLPTTQHGGGFFEGVLSLAESGLHASAVKLAEMAFGLHEAGHSCFSPAQISHAYRIAADYYFEEEEYHLAEHYFLKLIDAHEGWGNGGNDLHDVGSALHVIPDTVVVWKSKRAFCLVRMGSVEEAVRVLISIPKNVRTPKINLQLADLNRQRGCTILCTSSNR